MAEDENGRKEPKVLKLPKNLDKALALITEVKELQRQMLNRLVLLRANLYGMHQYGRAGKFLWEHRDMMCLLEQLESDVMIEKEAVGAALKTLEVSDGGQNDK